ncbi:MAG: molybdenum cofactor biosynthesis protein B [Nitrospiria bacterium]
MEWTAGILSIKEKGILHGEDRVTMQLSKMITDTGGKVYVTEVIDADGGRIRDKLIAWVHQAKLDLILTAGGSGLGRQDCTPDATLDVIDREVPALCDMMRHEVFRKKTKKAIISRAVSGIRNDTLIINLPGSPGPACENLEVILNEIPHLIHMIRPRDA